ncbi:MAG: metal ABC transporter permease [Rickettsiales bacterium]|jgi:zinc/manganese transport system permease protein|nr:metal ABC transporter permease [Rickettsiales bacterium]
MINMELIEIMTPALVVGLLVALTHGLLGIKVLERGIVFIDLAIAQIAGLGLVIAGIFLSEYSWSYQFIALSFAILASLFFYYIEKSAPDIQEAIIGCSFVLAASLSILFLSNHSHGSDEIKHLLSGQILFVTFQDILQHLPIYIGVIGLWFFKPQIRNGIGFYLIFAIAITSSVQLVGIYVVFASLILPAIAAKNMRNPLLISWICGIISVILGIIFAAIFDLPAGVLVVIAYFVVTCLIKLHSKIKHS